MCSSYGQLTGDASVGSDNGQKIVTSFHLGSPSPILVFNSQVMLQPGSITGKKSLPVSFGISLSYISVQLTGDVLARSDNRQKIAISTWHLPFL